jgi:hypothetical protein
VTERRTHGRDYKPWRREILLVAGLLIVISALGWLRVSDVADQAKVAADDANAALEQVERFTENLRDSAVSGCVRQNKVRKQQHVVQNILRAQLRDDIRQSQHLQPSDFPGFSTEEFERLLRRDIRQAREYRRQLAEKLHLAPCQRAYPSE